MDGRVLSLSTPWRAVALLVLAFGVIAYALPERGGMALDIVVANWLQARATERGATITTWISWLGDTALSGLLVAAVVVLAYRRRWAAATTVVFATFAGMWIAIALKRLFHRGRPDYAIEFIAGPTWSFPSGHAMASLVGYGIVAYFRLERERDAHRRSLIVMAIRVVVAAVGYSRLYLGVHYLSDVLGGFLAGAVWLLMCIEAYRLAYTRRIAG